MFQLKRNRQLQQNLAHYFATGQLAVDAYLTGMQHYVRQGPENLGHFVQEAHKQESACDSIRYGIEEDLFEKSLMPALREDIMLLLEAVDAMINECEDVLRQAHMLHVHMPNVLSVRLEQIATIAHEACTVVLRQAAAALEQDSHAKEHRARVDVLESDADRLEQEMITELFRGELPLAEKSLCRDIIMQVSRVADLAEDAANFLVVFRLKREI